MSLNIGSLLANTTGSAGWGLLGSALDYGLGRSSADRANEQNIYNAKHQYQWMMQDMRKAGLNPILASKMGPLNIPSAQMNPNSAVAANSATQQLQREQSGLTGQKSITEIQEAALKIAQVSMTTDQASQFRAMAKLITEQTKGHDYENRIKEIRAKIHTANEWVTFAQEVGASVGQLTNLIDVLFVRGKVNALNKQTGGQTPKVTFSK